MALVSVITNDGKNHLLGVGFGISGSVEYPFMYMAVGEGVTVPENDATGLSNECTTARNGSYSRVTLENTAVPESFMVKSEGTFDVTNITDPGATITEIGIVNTDIQEEGIFWCICQVDPTEKTELTQIKFTVYSTMLDCCPG